MGKGRGRARGRGRGNANASPKPPGPAAPPGMFFSILLIHFDSLIVQSLHLLC